MQKIDSELERELRGLACERFKQGKTYMDSSPHVAEALMVRYEDWSVSRYEVCNDRSVNTFYERYKLTNIRRRENGIKRSTKKEERRTRE